MQYACRNKRKAARSHPTHSNGNSRALPPSPRAHQPPPELDSDLNVLAPNATTPEKEDGPTLSSDILAIRIEIVNWSFDWGSEGLWEAQFHERLAAKNAEGQKALDRFFHECKKHAHDGREILKDLKFVGNADIDGTYEEIRDLFLQGFDMAVAVASEVKFCEVKLDRYAPAGPALHLSDIRLYDSDTM